MGKMNLIVSICLIHGTSIVLGWKKLISFSTEFWTHELWYVTFGL